MRQTTVASRVVEKGQIPRPGYVVNADLLVKASRTVPAFSDGESEPSGAPRLPRFTENSFPVVS